MNSEFVTFQQNSSRIRKRASKKNKYYEQNPNPLKPWLPWIGKDSRVNYNFNKETKMKNKAKVLSAALFLAVFIIVISFGGQKAEWKGKVEIENGIRVIKNPVEPLFGEIHFELDEDLSIGNESDDNFLFWQVEDIEVDMD